VQNFVCKTITRDAVMGNVALAGAGGTGVGVRTSPPSADSSASAAELPAEGSLLAGGLWAIWGTLQRCSSALLGY